MSYSCIWDGFDNYDASHEVWDFVTGSPVFSSTYARFPAVTGCVSQGVKLGAGAAIKKNVSGSQATMIVGMAFCYPSLPASGTQGFLAFVDAFNYQCNVAVNSTGAIVVRTGQAGTIIGQTSPGVITSNQWYWIDVQVTIGATGSMTIYLNQQSGGSAILTLSGVNTQGSSTAYVGGVLIGDFNGIGGSMYFDDFHAHDNTGSAPNAILGESRIYTKMPNGAGGLTNWTPNGAAANWQCVDEVPPDDDTSYVSSNTAGTMDSYAVPYVGLTLTPHAVVTRARVRRDDAGPHTTEAGVRSGTSTLFGTAFSIGSSYGWIDGFFATDPNTSAAWTASGADSAQVAIDETS